MPIYAYKCDSCGHAKDVLRKISDAPLTDCPQCGGASFKKQVTAAGFQLKGSGWYVTDFRGADKAAAPAKSGDSGSTAAASTASKSADTGTGTGTAAATASAPATATPAAASASQGAASDSSSKAS